MSNIEYTFENKFGFLTSETILDNDVRSTIEILIYEKDLDGVLTIFKKIKGENINCIIFSKEQVEWLQGYFE